MRHRSAIYIITTLFCIVSSCNRTSQTHHADSDVWSIIGNEIIFDETSMLDYDGHSIPFSAINHDYLIINCVDSSGCTPCKLQLSEWSDIIGEINLYSTQNIGFIIIADPNKKNEILKLANDDEFKYPIYFDEDSCFLKTNSNYLTHYQTFLLDNTHKIKAIGNPVTNPKIKDLYQTIIYGKPRDELQKAPIRLCSDPIKNLGVVSKGDTIYNTFYLTNRDTADHLVTKAEVCSHKSSIINRIDTIQSRKYTPIETMSMLDSCDGIFKIHMNLYYDNNDIPEQIAIMGFIK